MNKLALFLGLPRYNFSAVVGQGACNVGGHERGALVSLDAFGNGTSTRHGTLPDDLRQELQNFIRPFNDRLFQLTGKRCEWS